mmetsp:Transcript_32483/g.39983  ORF Transcript_32483/g.39983 Transcript_32483/m.39983 type:complete len:291 (-) Transcript_32483:90-962(-)
MFEVATEPLEAENPMVNGLGTPPHEAVRTTDDKNSGRHLSHYQSSRLLSSGTKRLMRKSRSSIGGDRDNTTEDDAEGHEGFAPKTPGLVRSGIASLAWQEQCLESKDERIYVVNLTIHKVTPLALHNYNGYTSTDTPDEFHHGSASSYDSFASLKDRMIINAFCVVSLLEPRTRTVLLKAKTPILNDSATPCWEEEFIFGNDRNYPIRGNEVLHIAVYNWELRNPDFLIGEFQCPLANFKSNNFESELIRLITPGDADVSISPELELSVSMTKFHQDPEAKSLISRSPML